MSCVRGAQGDFEVCGVRQEVPHAVSAGPVADGGSPTGCEPVDMSLL